MKLLNYIRMRKATFHKSESRKYIRQEIPVIVDIGAHEGVDTIEWREVFPKAKIYALEPHPEVFSRLMFKTEKYDIGLFNIALGNSNGYSKFYISSGKSTQSSSLRKPKLHLEIHPDVIFDNSVMVPVRRLDDWTTENDITRIDILWMDTQGTELEILKNGPKILSTVQLLHMEVALCEMYESQATYQELRIFLEDAGFYVYKELFGNPYNPKMGNVVFVRGI